MQRENMILTVTLNSALDRVIFIDEWETDIPMRTNKVITSVGGKGLDASVVLSHLGAKTVGLVFVAGNIGQELIQLVETYGIVPDPIWVDGETRIAHVIAETKHQRHSHIITGELQINQNHIDELLQRFLARVNEASWVICAGSIPPTMSHKIFRELVDIANMASIPVLVDTSREIMREAILARPAIVKMNWREFARTFAIKAPTMIDLRQHADEVFRSYDMQSLVITCSSDGILAFSEEGSFHVIPPKLKPVNAAGAGDAVSSALVWRLSLGDNWREALRWAGAASVAVVLTEGTADCRKQDIYRIYPDVVVQSI